MDSSQEGPPVSLPIYRIQITRQFVKVDLPTRVFFTSTKTSKDGSFKKLKLLKSISKIEDEKVVPKDSSTLRSAKSFCRSKSVAKLSNRSQKCCNKKWSKGNKNGECCELLNLAKDSRYNQYYCLPLVLSDHSISLSQSNKLNVQEEKESSLKPYNNSHAQDPSSQVQIIYFTLANDSLSPVITESISNVLVLNLDAHSVASFLDVLRSYESRIRFLRMYLPPSKRLYDWQMVNVIVLVRPLPGCFLDVMGSQLSNSYIVEKCEMDVALSWLSTLGGAFSALGDNSLSYAAEAGRVSMTQLRIAMKLQDPLIASRCRLYAAISLLQRGYLKSARDIVKREFEYAKSLPEDQDPRLKRMCFGVWAKLQYYWALNLMRKKGMNSFEEVFDKWSATRALKNGTRKPVEDVKLLLSISV